MPSAIYLATEDVLSVAILKRILSDKFASADLQVILPKPQSNLGGAGPIKQNFRQYLQAARNGVCNIILTDLDNYHCPPALLRDWQVTQPLPNKLIFRIAVREVESWLLADRQNIAGYLNVSSARVERNPEQLRDPKEHLISLASHSKTKKIKEGIGPVHGNYSPVGPDYNSILCEFVRTKWDYSRAASNAPSLQRMLNRLDEAVQRW